MGFVEFQSRESFYNRCDKSGLISNLDQETTGRRDKETTVPMSNAQKFCLIMYL